jgi:hypothetical protein
MEEEKRDPIVENNEVVNEWIPSTFINSQVPFTGSGRQLRRLIYRLGLEWLAHFSATRLTELNSAIAVDVSDRILMTFFSITSMSGQQQ